MNKKTVLKENPKLFKKFQETLNRAGHLMAAVILCDESPELYLFNSDRSGVDGPIRFSDYSKNSLMELEDFLNCRAGELKAKWLPEYEKLNETSFGGWCMDLEGTDYAEIIIMSDDVTTERHYQIDWSFEGVTTAAEYISDRSNPSPEVVERFAKKKSQKKKSDAC